jgi:hypothetical protein
MSLILTLSEYVMLRTNGELAPLEGQKVKTFPKHYNTIASKKARVILWKDVTQQLLLVEPNLAHLEKVRLEMWKL